MIKIVIHTSHLSFEMSEPEDFFSLGNKVLQKQPIKNVLRGLLVRFNGRRRILYSLENLQSVSKIMEQFTEVEKIQIITTLLEVIQQIAENGFLPKEAVVVKKDCLFWDAEKKMLMVIVLPMSREPVYEDKSTWIQELRDSLLYLGQFLQADKWESLRGCFEQMEATSGELLQALKALNDLYAVSGGNIMTGYVTDVVPMQMILQEISGQGTLRITVNKPQFILGKKQESVDGYIGLSNSVSRMHCRIQKEQEHFYCMDLGSLNHTYVNGRMIGPGEKFELYDKDILRLADVELQVHMMAAGGYR